MTSNQTVNRALLRCVGLPTIFLTVILLGGLRVDGKTREFLFVGPPLITLVLAVLLMALFVRGHLLDLRQWLSASVQPPLTNVAHALTLVSLFFASAQAFNSVLPESGLFHWLFSFFFVWTLWNNLFSIFDARRLLRSLAVLFGTAFVLKNMLLANLYAAEGGWLKQLTGLLLEGVSLGTLEARSFAPATGYISFFALVFYTLGLMLLPAAEEMNLAEEQQSNHIIQAYHKLSPSERAHVRDVMFNEQSLTEVKVRAVAAERKLIDAEK